MTTILALREGTNICMCADGAINNERDMRHSLFGVQKVQQIGEYLIGSAGCALLTNKVLDFLVKGDWLKEEEIPLERRLCLADGVTNLVRLRQDALVLIWGKKNGYCLYTQVLENPESTALIPTTFCNTMCDDVAAIGVGATPALAAYKALKKHAPHLSSRELLEACVECTGDVTMLTHSKPYFYQLKEDQQQ